MITKNSSVDKLISKKNQLVLITVSHFGSALPPRCSLTKSQKACTICTPEKMIAYSSPKFCKFHTLDT